MLSNQKIHFQAIGEINKHYENFPVASFLIPPNKRQIIRLVYWYARTADDIADEGTLPPDDRIYLLEQFQNEFQKSLDTRSELYPMNELANFIKSNKITVSHFLNLLSAFKQDVIKNRYENFDEILYYCERSANPVGRIVLEVFDLRDEYLMCYSDRICTALQLINFIQDTKLDLEKNRLYYPLDELEKFGLREDDFFALKFNKSLMNYIKFSVDRARRIMFEGEPLVNYLKGRFAIEIKWTISGGLEILKKIENVGYNVIDFRPTLSNFDYSKIFLKSLFR